MSSVPSELFPDRTLRVLVYRRKKLSAIIGQVPANTKLTQLLADLDAAIKRIKTDRYGSCEICNHPIEMDRLQVDPLLRYCDAHCAPEEQLRVFRDRDLATQLGGPFRELMSERDFEGGPPGARKITLTKGRSQGRAARSAERRWGLIQALKAAWEALRNGVRNEDERDVDIKRASDIQSSLLPKSHLQLDGWEVYYDYASAGPVGGDYCDLVTAKTGELFLFFGDVMGKGFAASMILSRLQAVFRTLLELKLSLAEMLERANRVFCECVQSTGYYATLVCGRASATGAIELINAGHLPPLLLRSGGAEPIVASGMPVGLFYASTYEVKPVQLQPGETLLFYTDGVTEARNSSDTEYGHERLARLAIEQSGLAPKELVRACRDDVSAFTSSAPLSDDLTLLALRRA